MNSFGLVGRILLLLALAGLLLAPLGAAMATPAMSAQAMSAQAMAAMADDMPCCPKQQAPLPDCGKDCPFVAFCSVGMGSVFTTAANSFELHMGDGLLMPNGHDFELASLPGEPPSRPPRA